jgi:hypothetical protein
MQQVEIRIAWSGLWVAQRFTAAIIGAPSMLGFSC